MSQKSAIQFFEGTANLFDPSPTNRIATGVSTSTYVARGQPDDKDYYYRVRPVYTAIHCPIPRATPPTPSSAYIARNEGYVSVPPFEDMDRQMYFSLSTSWIPAASAKVVMRYKLFANPGFGTSDEAVFLARSSRCTFFLELFDEQGFSLEKQPVYFQQTVDDAGKLRSFTANSSIPLPFSEYRQFEASSISRRWDISWSCPQY